MAKNSKHEAAKTNAMRMLETAGIPYRVATYEVDESDLSGMHVAQQLGQDPNQVFKTLVLECPGGEGQRKGHIVCCIPTDQELDFKKVSAAARVKTCEMLPLKELTQLIGYVRGGCSPLGMKKQFPTFIDETAMLFDEIAVSAGRRGEQIIVNAEELARVADATFADLVRD